MKSLKEIEVQHDKVCDLIEEGGKFFGMSYEEGVKAALDWVMDDDITESPIE